MAIAITVTAITAAETEVLALRTTARGRGGR